MNRLRKRIKELVGQSPSSVAYLADVTGADEADVQRELAAYAYEVLLRQLKKSRREYIKTELVRVRSASNKTARADQFCMGWVYAVAQKVEEFAMPPEEKGVLERYRQQIGEMGKAKTRDVKGKTSRMQQQQDLQAGHRQGRDAQLHQAMGADKYKQIGA